MEWTTNTKTKTKTKTKEVEKKEEEEGSAAAKCADNSSVVLTSLLTFVLAIATKADSKFSSPKWSSLLYALLKLDKETRLVSKMILKRVSINGYHHTIDEHAFQELARTVLSHTVTLVYQGDKIIIKARKCAGYGDAECQKNMDGWSKLIGIEYLLSEDCVSINSMGTVVNSIENLFNLVEGGGERAERWRDWCGGKFTSHVNSGEVDRNTVLKRLFWVACCTNDEESRRRLFLIVGMGLRGGNNGGNNFGKVTVKSLMKFALYFVCGAGGAGKGVRKSALTLFKKLCECLGGSSAKALLRRKLGIFISENASKGDFEKEVFEMLEWLIEME